MIGFSTGVDVINHFRDQIATRAYGAAAIVRRGPTSAIFLELSASDRVALPVLRRYSHARLIFDGGVLRRVLLTRPHQERLDRVDVPFYAHLN